MKKINAPLYWLLGAGFLLRLVTAPVLEGHNIDIACFKSWALSAARNFPDFYNSAGFVDYPPTYLYVLFIAAKVSGILGLISVPWAYTLLIKLPSITADIVTAYLIYNLSSEYLPGKVSLILSAAYAFNPLVFVNSTIWGQVDSFLTMMLIAGLISMLKGNLSRTSIFYAAAVLMKPQGIIFLPVLAFELLKRKDLKVFAYSAIYGIVTAILIILPFSFTQKPFWIIDLYFNTAGGYKGASVNAFNFFALLGANWKDDSAVLFIFSYKTWGFIFMGLTLLFVLFLYYKVKSSSLPIISSLLLITGVFVLGTRMHERYMFPAAALTLIVFIYLKDWRFLLFYVLSSLTGFINTVQVLALSFKKIYWVPADDITLRITAIVNILLLVYLIKITIDTVVMNRVIPLSHTQTIQSRTVKGKAERSR